MSPQPAFVGRSDSEPKRAGLPVPAEEDLHGKCLGEARGPGHEPAHRSHGQAALLPAPAARDAWERWQAIGQTGALDISSWMLIPLAYANLKNKGLENDPVLAQAKSVHLHYWCSNQRIFDLAAGFLDGLRDIKAVVLKGAVLANLYYPDIGCRPMADLDVLVPSADFLALGNRLLREGWTETDGHSLAAFQVDRMPSFGFRRQDGFSVDLHCHVLHADCSAHADDEFWANAQPWSLKEIPTLMLAPEDQLLHAVSHGVRWCDAAPFRWIADAWFILARNGAAFDWERFLEQARRHEITLPILRGLECMRRIVPPEIPPDVLPRLAAFPVSARAQVYFTVATHPLPQEFFPRARSIWEALGEEEPFPATAGSPGRPGRGKVRGKWALLLFAMAVVLRDRRQIFAELIAWMKGNPVNS